MAPQGCRAAGLEGTAAGTTTSGTERPDAPRFEVPAPEGPGVIAEVAGAGLVDAGAGAGALPLAVARLVSEAPPDSRGFVSVP